MFSTLNHKERELREELRLNKNEVEMKTKYFKKLSVDRAHIR